MRMNEKKANNDRVRYRELKEGQGEGGGENGDNGLFSLNFWRTQWYKGSTVSVRVAELALATYQGHSWCCSCRHQLPEYLASQMPQSRHGDTKSSDNDPGVR